MSQLYKVTTVVTSYCLADSEEEAQGIARSAIEYDLDANTTLHRVDSVNSIDEVESAWKDCLPWEKRFWVVSNNGKTVGEIVTEQAVAVQAPSDEGPDTEPSPAVENCPYQIDRCPVSKLTCIENKDCARQCKS